MTVDVISHINVDMATDGVPSDLCIIPGPHVRRQVWLESTPGTRLGYAASWWRQEEVWLTFIFMIFNIFLIIQIFSWTLFFPINLLHWAVQWCLISENCTVISSRFSWEIMMPWKKPLDIQVLFGEDIIFFIIWGGKKNTNLFRIF